MKKKRKFIIAILILIILILTLLFFCKFGKVDSEKFKTATGNVDIFSIDISCGCGEESCSINTNDPTKPATPIAKDRNGNDLPVYNDLTDKDVLGSVFVYDDKGSYLYQQKLDIFKNSAFEYESKIAPGVSNTYNFEVRNNTDSNLKYYLKMSEETEYKVNLKYRLLRNGEYVIGSDSKWVKADKLVTEFEKIKQSTTDSYSLEWKWFDDDANDTIAGENMTSEYKLNIKIIFEQDI